MGNKQEKSNITQKVNNKPMTKKRTEISPYREGLTGTNQSMLSKYLKTPAELNSMGLIIGEDNGDDSNDMKESETLRDKYFSGNPEEYNAIKKDFEGFSKENKMAKRKLLEYFGLLDLEQYKFGNRFFNCVKGSSRQQANTYLDFSKFLRAICMMSKNIGEERMRFLYSIFDLDSDGYIEKEEMLNIFMSFYEAMASIKFENDSITKLKDRISTDNTEQQIALAIQDIVNEIYEKHEDKPGILYYEKWKIWIEEQTGLKDVLSYSFYDNKYANK